MSTTVITSVSEARAFRLEDSPSGFPLQVLGRITDLRAFRSNP